MLRIGHLPSQNLLRFIFCVKSFSCILIRQQIVFFIFRHRDWLILRLLCIVYILLFSLQYRSNVSLFRLLYRVYISVPSHVHMNAHNRNVSRFRLSTIYYYYYYFIVFFFFHFSLTNFEYSQWQNLFLIRSSMYVQILTIFSLADTLRLFDTIENFTCDLEQS